LSELDKAKSMTQKLTSEFKTDPKYQTSDDSSSNDKTEDSVAAVSAILQRCKTSVIDGALSCPIDSNLLLDVEDEDEMRDAIGDENETDENIDDDLMDEDNDYSSTKASHETLNDASVNMKDLKRRHLATRNSQQRSQQASQYPEEFVLKCQFSALIPSFDPRPGKSNINQIQDITVPPPSPIPVTTNISTPTKQIEAIRPKYTLPSPKIELYLKCNPLSSSSSSKTGLQHDGELEFFNDEIKLVNKNATIFQYIQKLITLGNSEKNFSASTLRFEKMKSIWDRTYSIVYRERKPNSQEENDTEKPVDTTEKNVCSVDEILNLLLILKQIILNYDNGMKNEFSKKF
jgi:hypothetical protein